MRTIPFREILWAVAYELGLDPAEDLHGEQADAYASYINSWVRQLWHGADWPEWTRTEPRTPDTRHIVSYEAPLGAPATPDSRIGRALKLYLNDPETVAPPLESPLRLTNKGIHCGFEHGTQVWIKFQPPAPQFTARVWDAAVTYHRAELVYSPVNGECYVSNSGGNQGHDPTGQQGASPPPLTVALLQTAEPETPAINGRIQIIKVTQATDLIDEWATQHVWDILDGNRAVIASASYLALSLTESAADILTAIYNSLDANAALDAFTFTLNATDLTIQMEADQLFAVRSYYYTYNPPPSEAVVTGAPADPLELVYGDDGLVVTVGPYVSPPIYTTYNTINNIQYYVQAVAYAPAKAQIIELSMSAQSAIPKASYELSFIDTGGILHVIEYVNPGRSSLGILQGIVDEIQASPDPFFNAMSTSLDPALLKLKFAAYDMVSLNAAVVPVGNAWWELVRFPLALADPLIAGAKAAALKEQGQTDKGAAEMNLASGEGEAASFQALPYDPLTDQVRPVPRYRVAGPAPPQQQR
jgi:hypothetical protein